jgi:hypothetical protein
MDRILWWPVNRSKGDLRRAIGETQARTHRLIAESRELIARARRIREELARHRRERKDAA